MELGNCMLWNIESLEEDERHGDTRICRVPEAVRQSLNPKARKNIMFAGNSELRFVMTGDTVRITLRREEVGGSIRPVGILEVFQGDYQGSYEISPGAVSVEDTVITIHCQDWRYIEAFSAAEQIFSPKVTRVLLPYDWGISVGKIEGDIRLPRPEELPLRRLLCYGSSITHGGNASVPSGTYAFMTAQALGCDLINLGCAGSAYMDLAMAEYIAGRKDWDMAVFELGINVLEEWTEAELYHKAYLWVGTVKAKRPEAPVFITDIYYNHYDFEDDPRVGTFRKTIKECVNELQKQYKGLYYKSGREVMGTYGGLSSDGLHPSDTGHAIIAQNMVSFIKDRTRRIYADL